MVAQATARTRREALPTSYPDGYGKACIWYGTAIPRSPPPAGVKCVLRKRTMEALRKSSKAIGSWHDLEQHVTTLDHPHALVVYAGRHCVLTDLCAPTQSRCERECEAVGMDRVEICIPFHTLLIGSALSPRRSLDVMWNLPCADFDPAKPLIVSHVPNDPVLRQVHPNSGNAIIIRNDGHSLRYSRIRSSKCSY